MALQRPITYLHHHLQQQSGFASPLQGGEKKVWQRQLAPSCKTEIYEV